MVYTQINSNSELTTAIIAWCTANPNEITPSNPEIATTYGTSISNWTITDNVTSMANAFSNSNTSYTTAVQDTLYLFNQNIGSWNTSKVTDMSRMFRGADNFNNGGQPLAFDTSNVTDMSYMFTSSSGSSAFNQPLGDNFDTSNVTDMTFMFYNARSFNQSLGTKFDTSNVTDMSGMFAANTVFNQSLGNNFNTSNVTDMSNMFHGASAFNQPLGSKFDTSNVSVMSAMFNDASAFNQPLGEKFDTSKVEGMGSMFESASAFNQPLAFDTSKVTDMSRMFYQATAFTGDGLYRWDLSNIQYDQTPNSGLNEMFLDCPVATTPNNDLIWRAWQLKYKFTDAKLTAAYLTKPTALPPYTTCQTVGSQTAWTTLSKFNFTDATLADAPILIPTVQATLVSQTTIALNKMCVTHVKAGSLLFTIQVVYSSQAAAEQGAVAIDQTEQLTELGPYTVTTTVVPPTPQPTPQPTPRPTPQPLPPIVTSNICFPAGTLIKTDQGEVAIEKLITSLHTIKRKPIKHVTRTVTNEKYLIAIKPNALGLNKPNRVTIMSKDHKVEFDGQLTPAYRLLDYFAGVKKVKYNGEVLYNVLLAEYGVMSVNNLNCETLEPTCRIACAYRGVAYEEEERKRKVEMRR